MSAVWRKLTVCPSSIATTSPADAFAADTAQDWGRQAEALLDEHADKFASVIGDADSRLRLLNARLDEAAARTIELSVQAEDVAELGGLGDDVDQMRWFAVADQRSLEVAEQGERGLGAGR